MKKQGKKEFIPMMILSVFSLLLGIAVGISIPNVLRPEKEGMLASIHGAEGRELEADKVAEKMDADKILTTTDIVYQYHYKEDGSIESSASTPPYFLVGLTAEELKKAYVDWKLISFSPEQVVLLKEMEGKGSAYYMVGEKDGYVAVFYQEAVNGETLKEKTNTPISSLPLEDQEKLKGGIYVFGDEALYRLLEDYDD